MKPETDKHTKKRMIQVIAAVDSFNLDKAVTSEIAHHDILPEEEERNLFQKFWYGREKDENLKDVSDPTVKEAKEAKERLIDCHGRLVISLAKKHKNRGVPYSDLIQEGMIGLIRAIDKYELDRGARLSTYAAYWIHQNISRAIAGQARIIRLPVHALALLGKINMVKKDFYQKFHREPTVEELAKVLKVEAGKIKEVLSYPNDDYTQIDAPELTDLFPEKKPLLNPEEAFDKGALRKKIEEILTRKKANGKPMFRERNADIFRMRYGLNGGGFYLLEEVGSKFGLTRERIRQIEKEIILKLKFILADENES